MTAAAECVCTAPARVWHVQFAGSVRRPEDREALLFVLYSIVEHGEDPTSAELSAHLFGPGREAAMRRLLALLSRMGLADESDGRWSLTPLGVDALRKRSILVAKESVWRARLLHAGAIAQTLVSVDEVPAERLRSAKHDRITPAEIEHAALALDPWVGETVEPAGGGAELIIDADPEPIGVVLGATPMTVTWRPIAGRVEFGTDGWWADAVTCPIEDVLAAVDPDLADSWDDESGQLRISEKDLEVDTLFSRRFTVTASDAEIDGVGRVDDLRISTACGPVDEKDAANWVARRAVCLADRLQTSEVWAETVRAACDGLEEWDPEPPAKADVAARARAAGNIPAYWNLVAAEDWGL